MCSQEQTGHDLVRASGVVTLAGRAATNNWDLIVVGGGPAGAAAAIGARQLGLRILLLEADRFPRHHVGESLVYLWPVFERLELAEQLDATFQHKYGSTRVWGYDSCPRSSDFTYRSGRGQRPYSLQVERSLFDSVLLRRAASLGADTREGHRVKEVIWNGDRAVGVKYRRPDGAMGEALAPVVLDATGRSGLIARQKHLRVVDQFYPDMSVYGYFSGTEQLDGEPPGNLFIEAVPWGWFWFIPLHTGETSVGLVCDPSSRPSLRAQGLTQFFREAIGQSSIVRRLLAPAHLTSGPIGVASYGYRSERYAGPGWMVAGDAGSFMDPMWATGVANALADGLLAAAITEAVVAGRVEEAEALAFYERELSERAEHLHAVVKFVYAVNQLYAGEPFWKRRHQMAGPRPSPELIRRLARDPSAAYFLTVFQGMGVSSEVLAEMEREISAPANALPDPASWIPRLGHGVTLRRGVGLDVDSSRVVPGLEFSAPGRRYFTSNPAVAGAFEAVDGQHTAQAIIQHAMSGVQGPNRWGDYLTVNAAFVYAAAQQLLDVTT